MLKVFTINGNIFELDGDAKHLRTLMNENEENNVCLAGVGTRNLQTTKHVLFIPFSAIESIEEFKDDE